MLRSYALVITERRARSFVACQERLCGTKRNAPAGFSFAP